MRLRDIAAAIRWAFQRRRHSDRRYKDLRDDTRYVEILS